MDHRRVLSLLVFLPSLVLAAQGGPVYTDTGTPSGACTVAASSPRVRVGSDGARHCCTAGTWQACSGVSSETVTAAGSTTPRALKDRWAEVLNVKDFGAKGDNSTDDTAAINAAILAAGNGREVYFPSGAYRISSTILLRAKEGLRVRGEHGRAFGTSGARLVWDGNTTDPMIKGVYLKQFHIENIQLIAGTASPRAAILLARDGTYTSDGPGEISDVSIYGMDQFGIMFGDTDYANDYNVSEVTLRRVDIDARWGLYIAGYPSGSQNVNHHLYDVNFGYSKLERGVWIDGGHANCFNCTFNASSSPYDATAFYFTGDRSISQPIVIVGGYAEQIDAFIASEVTTVTTQWFRQASVSVTGGYWHTNRGARQKLIDVYKNLSITLADVQGVAAPITYSPPANSSCTGYSSTAPASGQLAILGSTNVGTVTLSRGGAVRSSVPGLASTVPSGLLYPSAGTLTLGTCGANFAHQEALLHAGSPGVEYVTTVAGGQVGWEIELAPLASDRSFTVTTGGNIKLQGANTSHALSGTSSRMILRLANDGKWTEVGGQETAVLGTLQLSAGCYPSVFGGLIRGNRTATGYRTDANGVLIPCASREIRVDTNGAPIVENEATNVIPDSTFVGTYWTITEAAISSDGTLGPDNATTVIKLCDLNDGYTSEKGLSQIITATSAPWSGSIYVKPAGSTWAWLTVDEGAGPAAFGYIGPACATGQTGTGNAVTRSTMGGGWCRLVVTRTLSGAAKFMVGMAGSDSGFNVAGNGTHCVYVAFAQEELGSAATSAIVTTTAPATRPAD